MIPGITGLDACRELAADDSFKLPIIAHPAILGSMLGGGTRNSVRGFAHEVLLGVLPRIAGCDMTIFPTFWRTIWPVSYTHLTLPTKA